MQYPLLANPHKHYHSTRYKSIDLIVLHVTAGLEDLDMKGVDHTATQTNEYGATTTREVSWHAVADSDSVEDSLPAEYTAFHVKDYNSGSLGLEICNKDARWDNKPKMWVVATLRNAAKKCHAWEKENNIPRILRTKAEIDAGARGYTYHMFLDPDRRHDPGQTFPIKLFFSLLAMLDNQHRPSSPVTSATPVRKRPNCTSFQRAIRTTTDNAWGEDTDKHAKALIEASDYGGNDFPYGVKFTQQVVGAKQDGEWGPNSKLAHKMTVMVAQKALAEMGFSPGKFDGSWGPKSSAAFANARQACHI